MSTTVPTVLLSLLLAVGCQDPGAGDDSSPNDTAPEAIDGPVPDNDWWNDDGWFMIVRTDRSACMTEPGGWWGVRFEGPLTAEAGSFSWTGTHTEAHSWKAEDLGVPVTATGTITQAALVMHLEVEGSPEHTSDMALEPTDFEDDDCWMNG
jgi:hypothetical protein